jgi:hypothetical protein
LAGAGGAWLVVVLFIAFVDYWAPGLSLPDPLAVRLFAPPVAAIALAGLCAAAAHFSLELGSWEPRIGPFIVGLKQRGDVATLARGLRSSDHDIRIAAGEALGELGTDAALYSLVQTVASEASDRGLRSALTHGDPSIRLRAFQMLKEMEIERSFGMILGLLDDPKLNAEARSLVEQQRPAMVVRHLLALDRRQIRESRAIQDVLIGKGSQVLTDKSLSFGFRYSTAHALFFDAYWREGDLGHRAWRALIKREYRDAVELGAEAIPIIESDLMDWLKTGIPDYKAEEAVWAIRRIGGPLAAKALQRFAEVRALRNYAQDALADLHSKSGPTIHP